MKAVVYTLGCKVNDVESGSIIRGLEEIGYTVSKDIEEADVCVLNTCAVTAEAERKSRQVLGKLLKCNPNAKIIVCGCASEKSGEDFFEKGAYTVLGAKCKNKVLEVVGRNFSETDNGVFVGEDCGRVYENMPVPKCLKTRNFVKIQDGCDRFCSYCIIPYLRGRNRGRNLEDAAKEILESDAYETVVTRVALHLLVVLNELDEGAEDVLSGPGADAFEAGGSLDGRGFDGSEGAEGFRAEHAVDGHAVFGGEVAA